MLTPQEIKTRSKFLSLVLRHQPEIIKIKPDAQGWVNIQILLQQLTALGPYYIQPFDLDILQQVVAENNKKRFAFNEDHTMIRASQGHSIEIQLGYDAIQPPELLFHGTARKNLPGIRKNGLQKGKRHDVHLTEERSTAVNVGGRHGEAVVLTIQAEKMFNDGYLFYFSENGVWLTNEIPAAYIWFD